MPAAAKKYHVMIHDGHWRLEGYVRFAGCSESGWTEFRAWPIVGLALPRRVKLQFTTSDWRKMGNSTVTIRRSIDAEVDYLFKRFSLTNNNGFNDSCSIHLS